jgi:hypothetical protein
LFIYFGSESLGDEHVEEQDGIERVDEEVVSVGEQHLTENLVV